MATADKVLSAVAVYASAVERAARELHASLAAAALEARPPDAPTKPQGTGGDPV